MSLDFIRKHVWSTPLLLLLLKTDILFIFISIWVLLLYTYVYEKKYNYTYILYFFTLLYLGFSINLFTFLTKLNYLGSHTVTIFFKNWVTLWFKPQITFYLDSFSGNFINLTVLLSLCIFFYAYNYMRADVYITTFIRLLIFFSISMITLLYAGDVFTIILGWELIGIASFLLIGFWYQKTTAFKAAFKAFSFNKLSDCFLFLFAVLFLQNDLSILCFFKNNLTTAFSNNLLLLCVLGCSFCKSVQFGFHLWLPDSMEAPVPASALIHSATLVSAGLYLSFRFSTWLRLWFLEISVISSFTAVYGALSAASQTDLKKILAYSTISHCGYLFFSIFFGNQFIFVLYLYLHGFFKAFAFVLVGFILQNNSIYQDSRNLTDKTFGVSFEVYSLPIILLNLGGIPFTFGFFSKSYLLSILGETWFGAINLFFIKLGSFGSVIYATQAIRLVFTAPIHQSAKHKTNIFTKKVNHTYISMILLSLLLITYLIIFIFKVVPVNNITLSQHSLIIFYKMLLVWFAVVFNFKTLTPLYLGLLQFTYIFF